MLIGENMRFRPAIFIWFVFAQSFFKFHKSRNDFCTLYNERAKALQSSIAFSYTLCIAKIYLFSFVETPRKFIICLAWYFHKAKQLYCIHHANVTYLQLLLPRLRWPSSVYFKEL